MPQDSGIFEGAAQRHMQVAVDNHRAQHFGAAPLQRQRRNVQRVEDRATDFQDL